MSSAECPTFRFDVVGSTNDVAKQLVRDGRVGRRAQVTAREQTAGRGQWGRHWISPKDAGIYLSVVERIDRSAVDLTHYTSAAGIACAEVLHEATGLDVRLKPVNDMYLDGRKLAGILVEAIIEPNGLRFLITGVGINVRLADRQCLESGVEPICLQEVMPPERFAYLDIDTLVERLADRVCAWNAVASAGESERIAGQWRYFEHDLGDLADTLTDRGFHV